jgi:translation initiation factor IF-3
LIAADGTQAGVVSSQEALAQAAAAGLDLVEIAPQANPPVVRVIDWGKYRYEKTKLQQKAKKKQKTIGVKQIRFGLKIGVHDQQVKIRKIQGFLENGNKVKLSVFFRGREMAHKELGGELLKRIVAELGEGILVDQQPEQTGKYLSMVIRKK